MGTSTSTGPGRGPAAIANALRRLGISASTLRTWTFHFVTGREMPSASHSWNASVPMAVVATWPLMQTMGTESQNASSSPVVVLLIPGPDVTNTTPTRPVVRA